MQKKVALGDIVDNPFQARKDFDQASVRSLANEIEVEGFWNTTLQARKSKKNGKVELVFGHRRLRALRLLKVPKIEVELVDLTDAQMALRGLEENLQRNGLTDLEKADAVKLAVEIAMKERAAAKAETAPEKSGRGRPNGSALEDIADRLGLDRRWVGRLCRISASLGAKNRAPVEAGHIVAQTAIAAKEWGGDEYVETLGKLGKKAKDDAKKEPADREGIEKPTHMTVGAMRKVVAAAPEPVREKLKAEIVAGKVTTPEQAKAKARRLESNHVRKEKPAPADLREVIVGWTHKLVEWDDQMRDVVPFMDYVDEVPAIAERFRAALRAHIETAKGLL